MVTITPPMIPPVLDGGASWRSTATMVTGARPVADALVMNRDSIAYYWRRTDLPFLTVEALTRLNDDDSVVYKPGVAKNDPVGTPEDSAHTGQHSQYTWLAPR